MASNQLHFFLVSSSQVMTVLLSTDLNSLKEQASISFLLGPESTQTSPTCSFPLPKLGLSQPSQACSLPD